MRQPPYSDEQSIMVLAGVVWGVHQKIHIKFIWIMIAVDMIYVTSHQMCSPNYMLREAMIFQKLYHPV